MTDVKAIGGKAAIRASKAAVFTQKAIDVKIVKWRNFSPKLFQPPPPIVHDRPGFGHILISIFLKESLFESKRPFLLFFFKIVMADHLASIYGTEKDKVNCSFYFKMGACRHGDSCTRKHVRPSFSPTILMPNVYINPSHDPACTLTPAQLQQHFDLLYEDLWCEMALKYGEMKTHGV